MSILVPLGYQVHKTSYLHRSSFYTVSLKKIYYPICILFRQWFKLLVQIFGDGGKIYFAKLFYFALVNLYFW